MISDFLGFLLSYCKNGSLEEKSNNRYIEGPTRDLGNFGREIRSGGSTNSKNFGKVFGFHVQNSRCSQQKQGFEMENFSNFKRDASIIKHYKLNFKSQT